MNTWECRGRSPLSGYGISLTSYSVDYAEGSAEGRSPLPGFGVSPKNSLFFSPPPNVLTERQRTPCILTERQLDAQQRCQNVFQEDAQQRCQDAFQVPQAEKRIALYWHNGRSLGHTVRCATLGQALLNYIPASIVVGITGASKGFELLPPTMDLVKIPSYLTYDRSEGVSTTPILSVAKEQFQHIRENLISTFIKDFQPHALIVDFHPEGKNGELIPTILDSPKTHKVLGLRGILRSPAETNRDFFNPRLVSFMQENFSSIHIYIDQQIFRLEDYYTIPDSLSLMFKYTGYVMRPTVSTRAEARASLDLQPDARIIVISFGGGQGTEPIWQAILHNLSKIQKQFDYAYLSSGPYLEVDAFERLQAQVSHQPNWKWTRLLNPLTTWIKASSLFIGSGGYNSLAEIIATGANSLIIPRQLNEREQEIHATKLASLNILRIANLDTILNHDLSSLLEMCLKEPYPQNKTITIATNGAQHSAELIGALIS